MALVSVSSASTKQGQPKRPSSTSLHTALPSSPPSENMSVTEGLCIAHLKWSWHGPLQDTAGHWLLLTHSSKRVLCSQSPLIPAVAYSSEARCQSFTSSCLRAQIHRKHPPDCHFSHYMSYITKGYLLLKA